jgi:hypothetical protein
VATPNVDLLKSRLDPLLELLKECPAVAHILNVHEVVHEAAPYPERMKIGRPDSPNVGAPKTREWSAFPTRLRQTLSQFQQGICDNFIGNRPAVIEP